MPPDEIDTRIGGSVADAMVAGRTDEIDELMEVLRPTAPSPPPGSSWR